MVVEDPGVEVRLYVLRGDDQAARVDESGVGTDYALALSTVGYRVPGDVAFVRFAGVNIRYRAAVHKNAAGR